MILCGSDRNVSRVQTCLKRHVCRILKKTVLTIFSKFFLAFCHLCEKNEGCVYFRISLIKERKKIENSPIHGRPI